MKVSTLLLLSSSQLVSASFLGSLLSRVEDVQRTLATDPSIPVDSLCGLILPSIFDPVSCRCEMKPLENSLELNCGSDVCHECWEAPTDLCEDLTYDLKFSILPPLAVQAAKVAAIQSGFDSSYSTLTLEVTGFDSEHEPSCEFYLNEDACASCQWNDECGDVIADCQNLGYTMVDMCDEDARGKLPSTNPFWPKSPLELADDCQGGRESVKAKGTAPISVA